MKEETIYLTFDVDWAPDPVIEEVVGLLKDASARATFFFTHSTPLLNNLIKDEDFEIGLHPNFSGLLRGAGSPGDDIDQILMRMKEVFPEAISVRSHCLISGTPISCKFAEYGFQIDSSLYVPAFRDRICSWPIVGNLKEVAFGWSDYIDILRNRKDQLPVALTGGGGTCVVAFHPIHIFLDTPNMEAYERFKKSGLPPHEFQRHLERRNLGGVRRIFLNALETVKSNGLATGLLRELLVSGE